MLHILYTNYVSNNSRTVSKTLKMRSKLLESTRNSKNVSEIFTGKCRCWMFKFQEWTQIFPERMKFFPEYQWHSEFLRESFLLDSGIPLSWSIRLECVRNSWNSWEIPGMRAKFLDCSGNSTAGIPPPPHARTFACKWQTIHFRYRTNPRFLYTNNIAVSQFHNFNVLLLKSILYYATTNYTLYLVSNRIWVHNKLVMRNI